MTPEQMQLLRDTVSADKGNSFCIAVLNLLAIVENQEATIVVLKEHIRLMKEQYE